jgi:hypothetical protein
MPQASPITRRDLGWSPIRFIVRMVSLRRTLVLGSVFDVVAGSSMMVHPTYFLALTGVPDALAPAMVFWPRYAAVFLFVLPSFYMLAAFDPNRHRGNILGAVYGRLLGCVFYTAYWMAGGAHQVFLWAALVNLAFAVRYWIGLARLPLPATVKQ